jgi:hypothetical protein
MSALPRPHHANRLDSIAWSQATATWFAAEWLRDALAALAELSRLGNDWDSYGSQPLTPVAIREARALILHLAETATPRPTIRPLPGGGVQIECSTGKAELELTVDPDGQKFFLTLDDQGRTEGGPLASFLASPDVALIG